MLETWFFLFPWFVGSRKSMACKPDRSLEKVCDLNVQGHASRLCIWPTCHWFPWPKKPWKQQQKTCLACMYHMYVSRTLCTGFPCMNAWRSKCAAWSGAVSRELVQHTYASCVFGRRWTRSADSGRRTCHCWRCRIVVLQQLSDVVLLLLVLQHGMDFLYNCDCYPVTADIHCNSKNC